MLNSPEPAQDFAQVLRLDCAARTNRIEKWLTSTTIHRTCLNCSWKPSQGSTRARRASSPSCGAQAHPTRAVVRGPGVDRRVPAVGRQRQPPLGASGRRREAEGPGAAAARRHDRRHGARARARGRHPQRARLPVRGRRGDRPLRLNHERAPARTHPALAWGFFTRSRSTSVLARTILAAGADAPTRVQAEPRSTR